MKFDYWNEERITKKKEVHKIPISGSPAMLPNHLKVWYRYLHIVLHDSYNFCLKHSIFKVIPCNPKLWYYDFVLSENWCSL